MQGPEPEVPESRAGSAAGHMRDPGMASPR